MTTTRFAALDVETADPAARPLLVGSAKTFGFIPSPVAKAAHSPALLKHLLAGFGAFDHSSLSPVEREVVAFAVSFEVGCHYYMALHSALSAKVPEFGPCVDALREGRELPTPSSTRCVNSRATWCLRRDGYPKSVGRR